MTRPFLVVAFSAMWLSTFGVVCLADDGFRYRNQDIPPTVGDDLEASREASEKALANGVFDPRAEKLLAAAGQFTKSVFNLPTLQLAHAVTLHEDGDDLVSKWLIDEAYAKGMLYLYDSPYISRYEFRIDDGIIQSREDVFAFLSNLIVWKKPPVNLLFRRVFEITLPPANLPVNSFLANATLSSTDKVADFNFLASRQGQEWHIQVLVGKLYTHSIYPVAPFIPERFPPLDELVQSWSYGKIWGEVGKPNGPHPWEDYSDHRDFVLITELARRGISEEQFSQLLRNTHPALFEKRAVAVIGPMQSAGKASSLARYSGTALATFEQIEPAAADAVDTFIIYARRSCSPPYEAQALGLLKKGIFLTPAFAYLGECSISKEVLHSLESYAPPADTEPQRQVAIQKMLGRNGAAK